MEIKSAQKSKLDKLNFNLLNILFAYLPFNNSIDIFYTNKLLIRAFKKTKFYDFLINSENLNQIISTYSGLDDSFLNELQKNFKQFFDNFNLLKYFISFLLNKIYGKINKLKFKSVNLKEEKSAEILSQFIATNKHVKELILDQYEIKSKSKFLEILKSGIFKNKTINSIDILLYSGYENLNKNELENKINFITEILINMPYLSSITLPHFNYDDYQKAIESLKTVIIKRNDILNFNPVLILTDNVSESIPFIDLIKNNKIKNLILTSTNFTSISKNLTTIADALKTNTSITSLKFSNGNIYPLELARFLKEVLSLNNTINDIDLSSNCIANKTELIKALKKIFADSNLQNKILNIKTLNLTSNNIGDDELKMENLLELLAANNSINNVNLSFNNLSKNQNIFKKLCLRLENNKLIESLDLSVNSLHVNFSFMNNLKNALVNNSTLKILNLRNNGLGNEKSCLESLKDLLVANETLEEIDLSSNCLYAFAENFTFLGEAIKKNKRLKKLNLAENNICLKSKEDVLSLKDGLIINSTLEILDLSFNCIQDSEIGLNAIKDILIQNKKLKDLDLSGTLNKKAASILIEALKDNSTLECLRVNGLDFFCDENLIFDLIDIIDKNQKLKKIEIKEKDFVKIPIRYKIGKVINLFQV